MSEQDELSHTGTYTGSTSEKAQNFVVDMSQKPSWGSFLQHYSTLRQAA